MGKRNHLFLWSFSFVKRKNLIIKALLFFLLLSIVHTWPLTTNPVRLSRNDTADTLLNEWIISWIAHKLPHDPLNLFNANIFYPEPRTLAFSEPLLIPGIFGIPIRCLGASPVLTYNILLIIGFTLTGLAMYKLIWKFTHDHIAGLLSGSLIAFNAHTLTRLPHLQAHYAMWLPLALLFFDRLLVRKNTKDALWLALFITLLAVTSGYLGVFAVIAIGISLLIRIRDWWGVNAVPFLSRIGLAGLITCTIVFLLLSSYWYVHKYQGLSRSLDAMAIFSASPSCYLATGGRFHYSIWSHFFYKIHAESLFPGVVAMILSAGALVSRSHPMTKMRLWMFFGIGTVGVLLSFGPATPLFIWFYHLFPPLKGIRAASRFGYLFLLAVAALSGYGLAKLRKRYTQYGWITPLGIILLLTVNLEALRAPMRYTPFKDISPVYKIISSCKGPSVVAEMPFYEEKKISKNAPYMLASTVHWKPILNGYSGYTPRSYARRAHVLWTFPSGESIKELDNTGVTHVVVHLNRYPKDKAESVLTILSRHPKFSLLARSRDGIMLYRLVK